MRLTISNYHLLLHYSHYFDYCFHNRYNCGTRTTVNSLFSVWNCNLMLPMSDQTCVCAIQNLVKVNLNASRCKVTDNFFPKFVSIYSFVCPFVRKKSANGRTDRMGGQKFGKEMSVTPRSRPNYLHILNEYVKRDIWNPNELSVAAMESEISIEFEFWFWEILQAFVLVSKPTQM